MKLSYLVVRGRKRIVLGVAVGGAYADELKLLWAILDRFEFKARHFVTDGYYDSVRLIKHFEQRRRNLDRPLEELLRGIVRFVEVVGKLRERER